MTSMGPAVTAGPEAHRQNFTKTTLNSPTISSLLGAQGSPRSSASRWASIFSRTVRRSRPRRRDRPRRLAWPRLLRPATTTRRPPAAVVRLGVRGRDADPTGRHRLPSDSDRAPLDSRRVHLHAGPAATEAV